MTTFIPFPDPSNGNPKQIASEVFAAGQEIKVRATGNLPGANPSQLIKTSVAVEIEPASSWVSVPLDSNTTTYGMHYGEYVTNATANYQPMAWVTFQADDFTNAGLTIVDSQPQNPIGTDAQATAYENFLYNVAITRLTAQGCQDGTPICIDPEDLGFDKALFYHDIYRSWKENWEADAPNSFASILNPYDSDGDTGTTFAGVSISVAAPLILRTMENVKARLNVAYPNSPIGFYSVGSAAFWLTGWSGCYKDNTNTADSLCKSWEIMNDVFAANTASSPADDWWGHQAIDALDFVFNAYYPAQNDDAKLPFPRFGSDEEVLKNFLHLFVSYFGPSGAGAAQGAKMMLGVSVRANVPTDNLSAASYEWTQRLIAGGAFFNNGADLPAAWYNSTLTYPDFDTVAMIGADLNSSFVYTPIEVQNDLIKWMNQLPGDTDAPDGFQSPPTAAGNPAGMPALTDSLRDFPMAIWDGGYISLYSSVVAKGYGEGGGTLSITPNGGEVATFRSLYTKQSIMDAYTASGQTSTPYQTGTDTWLSDAMDADAANYITLYSSKGAQDWYGSSASFDPSSVGTLTNWYDFSDPSSPLTNKGTPGDSLTGDLSELGGSVPTTTINSLTAMNVGNGISLGTEFQNSAVTNAGSTVFMVMKSSGTKVIPINEAGTFSLACDSGSTSTTLGSIGGTTYVNGVASPWTTRGEAATALLTGNAVVYTASACELGWLQTSGLAKVMEFGGYAVFDDLTAYGEILMYTDVLSAEDQASVEQYLMDKWGVEAETILDTFTAPGGGSGPDWKSANDWWNGWHTSGGTWSSTGTTTGTYVTIDSGSQLRKEAFRLGPATGTALPPDAQVRVTFTPSSADSGTSVLGAQIGGDETFYWTDGPFTVAEIEEGGTFGWNTADDITIEIFTVN